MPPPPSSAGVPITVTVSPRSSTSGASARPGADRGRGDDVVTARVTDPGERVVLRADREMQRPISEPTREGGREFADTRFDRESGIGEQTGRPCARPLLLELQLGVRVDAMTQRDERRFVF